MVITAIGQGIETAHFEEFGLEVKWGVLQTVDESLEDVYKRQVSDSARGGGWRNGFSI